MIEILERVVRLLGVAGLLTAWAVSGRQAIRDLERPPGRALGLARRIGPLATYLVAAIPYFTAWIILWHPLPGDPVDWLRVMLLVVGGALGAVGLAVYLWGRLTLGTMYNVSSTLGTGLHRDHRLITVGPFCYVRHPMYFGIAVAALGGLAVYRTWAMVLAVVALPGFALKAHHEERLLAAEFGSEWQEYTAEVPAWWPRRRSAAGPHAMIEQGESS